MFLNENREEIDRIIGYMNTEKFLSELKRIKSGKNTLPFLKTSIKKTNNCALLYKISKKYQEMNDIKSSKKVINLIIDKGIYSLKFAEYMSILFEDQMKH